MKKILISSNMVLGSLGLTYSQCFEKLGLNVIKFDDSLKINYDALPVPDLTEYSNEIKKLI